MNNNNKNNNNMQAEILEEIDVDTLSRSAFHSNNHGNNVGLEKKEQAPTNKNQKQEPIQSTSPLFAPWTFFTEDCFHRWVRTMVVGLSSHAARHPFHWVVAIGVFSLAIVAIGFFTNFRMEFDQKVFLLPTGSQTANHGDWIYEEFRKTRMLEILLHKNGDNVLTAEGVQQAMEVIDTITEVEGFEELCQPCRNFTITQFWYNTPELLKEELNNYPTTQERDEYIQKTVSVDSYPDTVLPVFHQAIMGNYQNETNNNNNNTWILTSAQSLLIRLEVPDIGSETDEFETKFVSAMRDLQKEYESHQSIQLEYFTMNTVNTEFERATNQDLPLVLVLIVVMMTFTCLVFYRHGEKVHSHAILGLFGFTTIGCSLMTGYGLMFVFGVPMTSIGIMVPFVVAGVALDDTFIITGAYFRHQRENQHKPKEQQKDTIMIIQDTMEEVGLSITMTTCTTLVCFLLGSPSSIPGVRWLCYYAATTIGVDFFYQITFFIALLRLDDMRVQSSRRDLCFWMVIRDEEDEEDNDTNEEDDHDKNTTDGGALEELSQEHSDDAKQTQPMTPTFHAQLETTKEMASTSPEHNDMNPNFIERFMNWYADKLLHPVVQVIVIAFFLAYFAGCTYSTSILKQEFNVVDYVPSDSNIAGYQNTVREYTSFLRFVSVYFRNVDQSNATIQEQMNRFVSDIAEMDAIGAPPDFFWLRDFEQLASSGQLEELGIDVEGLTFNQKIDLALSVPAIDLIYGHDIVRDDQTGDITASRTHLYLSDIDFTSVHAQVDLLNELKEVTNAQPINAPENRKNGKLSFFTYDESFIFWEVYDTIVDELIYTTISCVVAVTMITLLFIPHWTAVMFVTPLIIVMYFMLLGTMQYAGLRIQAITYFIIVTAIGLLVDFLMHVLLRYYETKAETRRRRVRATLETMGTSILLGGFTTWLGVLPLSLSSTSIFMMVFIGFFAMVTLGVLVGLSFLPVLLSIFGPMSDIRPDSHTAQIEQSHRLAETEPSVRKTQLEFEQDLSMCINEVEC